MSPRSDRGKTAAARAAATLLAAAALLAGCEPALRNMYDQPKLKTAAASPLFADGLATRPPPPGAEPVALGEIAADSGARRGQARVAALAAADAQQSLVVPVAAAQLARGRERFAIYCAPCHGSGGRGDGTIVQRGFPAPPSYAEPRLLAAPDRHFFDVMTQGYGVMYSYAGRVDAEDRWAIVAWIRHLQQAARPIAAARSSVLAATSGRSGTEAAPSATVPRHNVTAAAPAATTTRARDVTATTDPAATSSPAPLASTR